MSYTDDLPALTLTAQFAGGDQVIGDMVRKGFNCYHGSRQPSLTGLVADIGQLTTTFENADRKFDPTFTTGPYYPDLVPGIPLALVGTWPTGGGGTDYPLIVGYAKGWPQKYDNLGLDQIVPVTAPDLVSRISRAQLTAALPRQLTGARIAAVLADAGYAGTTALDGGTALVPAFGATGATSAWSVLGDAVNAEWGYGFVTGAGVPTFLDRIGIDSISATPVAVFGDRPDLGELPCAFPEAPYDDTRTVNDADLIYDDQGRIAHAEDLTSQGREWGKLSWRQSIPIHSGALARSYCHHVVSSYATPTLRFAELIIKPQEQPNDLWPIVLALTEGQRFTAKKTPEGGGARIERDIFVRYVEHDLTDGDWTTTVAFDDANLDSVDSIYGDGKLYGDGTFYSF